MIEKIILEGQTGKISAILSYPDDAIIAGRKLSAILLLHGFGTNKDEVNSVYKEMASMFEAEKMVSLRIDFFGYGESDGEPEESSLDTMIADAKSAFEYLRGLPYVETLSISIVGFSLGAAIAMLLTKSVSCRALALLSPTLHLSNDFTAFLGKTVMDDLNRCNHFLEVDLSWRKIKIGRKFYNSLFQHTPLAAIKNYSGSLFCIAGEKDFSCKNAEDIYTESPSTDKFIKIVGHADHIFSKTNGDSELFKSASKAMLWLASIKNSKPIKKLIIQKIISGGQTGVDQAALKFAITNDIPYGGWCPKGRKAENGIIPAEYLLRETDSEDYSERTKLNIRDSDGTLILVPGIPIAVTDGTLLTIQEAEDRKKPFLIVDLFKRQEFFDLIKNWVTENNIKMLNIAGPRESQSPGLHELSLKFLEEIIVDRERKQTNNFLD